VYVIVAFCCLLQGRSGSIRQRCESGHQNPVYHYVTGAVSAQYQRHYTGPLLPLRHHIGGNLYVEVVGVSLVCFLFTVLVLRWKLFSFQDYMNLDFILC